MRHARSMCPSGYDPAVTPPPLFVMDYVGPAIGAAVFVLIRHSPASRRSISGRELSDGQSALEDAAAHERTPPPVVEIIEFLVFHRGSY